MSHGDKQEAEANTSVFLLHSTTRILNLPFILAISIISHIIIMLLTIIINMQTQMTALPNNLKSLIRPRPQKKMQISVLIAPSIKDKVDAALKAGIKTTDLVNAALEAFLNKEVQ